MKFFDNSSTSDKLSNMSKTYNCRKKYKNNCPLKGN